MNTDLYMLLQLQLQLQLQLTGLFGNFDKDFNIVLANNFSLSSTFFTISCSADLEETSIISWIEAINAFAFTAKAAACENLCSVMNLDKSSGAFTTHGGMEEEYIYIIYNL